MKKRGSCLFLLVFFVILLASFANAETSPEINKTQAYEWLYEQMNSSSWNENVDEIALSILALGSGDYNLSDGIDKLRDLEYGGSNWGNIKDTSLATLALNNVGEDMEDETKWLKTQYVMAFTGGNWLIQVDTAHDGECTLNHDQTGITHDFSILEGKLTTTLCEESNWIDFERCISLVGINEDIEISCELGGTYSPSLIFQSSDEYYLFDQGKNMDLENGCFLTDQGSCSCEYSGYAAWVLDKLGEETYVNPYLKFKCSQNIARNSFLYMLLDSSDTGPYSIWLKGAQWPDGSWGVDEESAGEEEYTALAILALKQKASSNSANIRDASKWLATKQMEDGSWNGNIRDTAFILYVLYGKDYVPYIGDGDGNYCGDGYMDDEEDCEYDSHCNITGGEICTDSCECVLASETNETGNPQDPDADPCGDGFCDRLGGESCDSCRMDCLEYCSDDDDYDYDDDDDDDDDDYKECIDDEDCGEGERCNKASNKCEEKSSWLKWLVAVLAVLLGVAIIYYVYMRYFKDKLSGKKSGGKQPPKSSPFPFKQTKQRVPIRRPPVSNEYANRRDSKIEKELEESLKKARDVLKK